MGLALVVGSPEVPVPHLHSMEQGITWPDFGVPTADMRGQYDDSYAPSYGDAYTYGDAGATGTDGSASGDGASSCSSPTSASCSSCTSSQIYTDHTHAHPGAPTDINWRRA